MPVRYIKTPRDGRNCPKTPRLQGFPKGQIRTTPRRFPKSPDPC